MSLGFALRRLLVVAGVVVAFAASAAHAADDLRAGFGEADITPDLKGKKPVWLAGYGMNRKATGVHDPIMARCMVLTSGTERIAMVSVDLVGLQYPATKLIREQLPDFRYVLVASTHNHEGPDVIGIWGRGPFTRGVDDAYITRVVESVVALVKQTAQTASPVTASYGTAADESLLGDSRKPYVKDGVLRVLQFKKAGTTELAGLFVQWNCHPESLGPRNTLLTADFPYYTISKLKEEYLCPVVYFSGAIGGLMAPPKDVVRDATGKALGDGNYEYARIYGEMVASLARSAMGAAEPIQLAPFAVFTKPIAIPVRNSLYRLARVMGVIQRDARTWTGDFESFGEPMTAANGDQPSAVESEVAYLRLGELHVACIPGELYPELVYGQIQNPADPGADFPDAPLEPSVDSLMPGKKWLLLGLANDEVGYIIPRRQWDNTPPHAYGREDPQYGEINSCGHDVAPIIMEALKRRVQESVQTAAK